MSRKLRVLVLVHHTLVPPDDIADLDPAEQPWRTEYDVVSTLRDLRHEVRVLGVESNLRSIRRTVDDFKPDIAFNLLEEFDGEALYDQNVVSYLELLGLPYTGCNPRGLILTRDKGLSKKILFYHRIPAPDFAVFPKGRRTRRPKRLGFPLIVKSLIEEASFGISQASLVRDDESLAERVAFIHDRVKTDAIAESYIEGRELYVGILGNHRLETLPIWELLFTKLPDQAANIATAKVKWDFAYQEKHGITSEAAANVDDDVRQRVIRLCKRAYRTLGMNGYARMDLRLTEAGDAYLIEANPNPQIAYGEDFAESAAHAGIDYHRLLQRILNLGLRWGGSRAG